MSTGRRATHPSGPRFVLSVLKVLLGAWLFVAASASAAPPGAQIDNQAFLNYDNLAGQPAVVPSNQVSVVVAVTRSDATVEFTRVLTAGTGLYQEPVGPAACLQVGAFSTLPDPVISGGTTIVPTAVQEVIPASSFNLGDTIFLRVADSDQNVDYQVVDTLTVDISNDATGDMETLQLYETGPDTGVFVGFIASARDAATIGDCVLQGSIDSIANVTYTDPADPSDTAEASASLDPTNIVFESRTGTPVDGIQVEIVDDATGLPATVYGNDGISSFPSSIVTGTTVTDSSGETYPFGTGEFRFPVVANGNYRLVTTPPTAYVAPSTVPIADLQLLPGAPYSLGAASFGNAFAKTGPEPIQFDLPIDPSATALFMQKRTFTTSAAPGDFVRYELTLENTSDSGIASDVVITDSLPPGVRFVSGSVVIDNVATDDPEISEDAATLVFEVPDISAGMSVRIFYVVEIVSGERDDELSNRATARASGGLVSNESVATIRLTEDLFRSTGTIIGRILEADCTQESFAEDQGVGGIKVYLEDGRYAVSDAGGRFHFEGVEAGTHVAQVDTFTVPEFYDIIGCAETPGYSGSSDSQFVKLSRGSLQRADFYLRRKEPPQGRIDIEMHNSGTDSPDQVAYDIRLNAIGNVDISNIGLTIVLPDGVSYRPETLRVDGEVVGEPQLVGPSLSLSLPPRIGSWTSEVSFVGDIGGEIEGELTAKALAKFDTPMAARQMTPIVETTVLREPGIIENAGYVLDLKFAVLSDQLSVQDKQQLDALINSWRGVKGINISAIGHSDSQKISARNQHIFENNYVLSQARAMAAAFYIADKLQISTNNIQVEGRGPDDPVADNATAAGRQQNRRVELIMTGLRPTRPSFLEATQASSGTKQTQTVGAIPGMESVRRRAPVDLDFGMPSSQKIPAMGSLSAGYAILLPAEDFAPAIPATKVAIQHNPGQTIELTLNGAPVNKLNFAGTSTNITGTVAVSSWSGVDLENGTNEFKIVIWNADGSKAKTMRRSIDYAGGPIRAEFVESLSTLVADGRTVPTLAIRLFDRSGKPARAGVVGQFHVDAPYRSAWDEINERKNSLVEIGDRSATYRVEADGIAYLELAPTSRTGEVTVFLPFENYREQEMRAWLKPAQRDWILVGFAEGTAAHTTLSDNLVAAAAAGHEDGYYDEGRVAFFAKGSIKGEFLLTVAYDSDRDREQNRNRFETIVDPNAYYVLYADKSEQRFEAASQRKIYLKLERNQFNALFGDFDTGLSVTDLARYQRRFNGFKSEYRGRNLGYTAFAAETDQSFNRDEIRGNGTSGLYYLTTTPIIANSEKIRIEVRDRFDSGVVISERNLTPFLDYTLDVLDGSIYFKKPVPSRDLDFNPVFIVAEYESIATGTEDIVAGGRGSIRFADDRVEVGATHINDATTGAEADLSGVDLRWQVNEQTLVKAEIAESNSIVANVAQSGSAMKVELEHNSEKVDVRAFIREVEDGYGLGYQSASDAGVRRLGIDGRARIGERFVFEGEAGWQQILATEDIRNLAEARIRYENEDFTARFGLAHAEDKFTDGDNRTSQLAEVGASQRVMDGRLRLHASASYALNEEAESLDYPQRYVVGADYNLTEGVDLVAEYETAEGRDIEASMGRVGVRASPWSRSQINTFLTSQTTEFGPRMFANLGLVQGFQLNERWTMDVGFDSAKTVLSDDARPIDPDREISSGSLNGEDFMVVYAGAMYSDELWSANTRVEFRDSDLEDRTSMLFGWYREPDAGHGLSAGFTMFQSDSIFGGNMSQANLRLGWAYRLADRKWSFLNRTDLISEELTTIGAEQKNQRFINNFNANRRIGPATSLSLQYAFKYVRSDYDELSLSGYTDLIGVDFRHGFRDRWDAGVNTSIYHSYRSKVLDYGLGVDVGYNVGKNMWLTLGYNFAGFEDEDFSAARYTAAGPYFRFTFKADQHLLKQIAGR